MSSTRRKSEGILRSLLFRFRRLGQRRSLSTGDLAVNVDADYMQMEFYAGPTTSKLSPSFDDCDRVPMDFDNGKVVLLPQWQKSARTLLQEGCSSDLSKFTTSEIHTAQPWFFRNICPQKAERLTMQNQQQGSFLIFYNGCQYTLSLLHAGKCLHIKVHSSINKNGQEKFRIDLEHSFTNLEKLVNHYQKDKGFVLPCRLQTAVRRPLQVLPERTRA